MADEIWAVCFDFYGVPTIRKYGSEEEAREHYAHLKERLTSCTIQLVRMRVVEERSNG